MMDVETANCIRCGAEIECWDEYCEIHQAEIEAEEAEVTRLIGEIKLLSWMKAHPHQWEWQKTDEGKYQSCANCGVKR